MISFLHLAVWAALGPVLVGPTGGAAVTLYSTAAQHTTQQQQQPAPLDTRLLALAAGTPLTDLHKRATASAKRGEARTNEEAERIPMKLETETNEGIELIPINIETQSKEGEVIRINIEREKAKIRGELLKEEHKSMSTGGRASVGRDERLSRVRKSTAVRHTGGAKGRTKVGANSITLGTENAANSINTVAEDAGKGELSAAAGLPPVKLVIVDSEAAAEVRRAPEFTPEKVAVKRETLEESNAVAVEGESAATVVDETDALAVERESTTKASTVYAEAVGGKLLLQDTPVESAASKVGEVTAEELSNTAEAAEGVTTAEGNEEEPSSPESGHRARLLSLMQLHHYQCIESAFNDTNLEGGCSRAWDSVLCWPPSPPSTIVHLPCPTHVPGLGAHQQEAVRWCDQDGNWETAPARPPAPSTTPLATPPAAALATQAPTSQPSFSALTSTTNELESTNVDAENQTSGEDKDGPHLSTTPPKPRPHTTPKPRPSVTSSLYTGWTNYSQCLARHPTPPPVPPLIQAWLPTLKQIALAGYSISLMALLLSFTVLASLRKLRCARNFLHLHLFASFMLRAVAVLLRSSFLNYSSLAPAPPLPGNDPITVQDSGWGCKVGVSLWQYFIMCNYSWLLMEGLYLHNLIFRALFTDSSSIRLYVIIGWGLPLLLVSGWSVCRAVLDNTFCWLVHSNPWLFWSFLRLPVAASVFLNFFFFINVVRVLALKLQTGTAATSKYRQLMKSTLVLVPLFGVHYCLLWGLSLSSKPALELAWLILDQVCAAFQGLFVGILYCLLNGEVRQELRKVYWAVRGGDVMSTNTSYSTVMSRSSYSRYRQSLVPGAGDRPSSLRQKFPEEPLRPLQEDMELGYCRKHNQFGESEATTIPSATPNTLVDPSPSTNGKANGSIKHEQVTAVESTVALPSSQDTSVVLPQNIGSDRQLQNGTNILHHQQKDNDTATKDLAQQSDKSLQSNGVSRGLRCFLIADDGEKEKYSDAREESLSSGGGVDLQQDEVTPLLSGADASYDDKTNNKTVSSLPLEDVSQESDHEPSVNNTTTTKSPDSKSNKNYRTQSNTNVGGDTSPHSNKMNTNVGGDTSPHSNKKINTNVGGDTSPHSNNKINTNLGENKVLEPPDNDCAVVDNTSFKANNLANNCTPADNNSNENNNPVNITTNGHCDAGLSDSAVVSLEGRGGTDVKIHPPPHDTVPCQNNNMWKVSANK